MQYDRPSIHKKLLAFARDFPQYGDGKADMELHLRKYPNISFEDWCETQPWEKCRISATVFTAVVDMLEKMGRIIFPVSTISDELPVIPERSLRIFSSDLVFIY